MKAYQIETAGGVENLNLVEIDQPTLAAGDVLIETKAISINPADVQVRATEEGLTMLGGAVRPIIMGWDVAGVVAQVGKDVSTLKVGDRVFGMVNFPGMGKTYAEFVAAPADQLAIIPSNSSFEEAAAATLSALTALQVLRGRVKAGDTVLVHAGSGGVGHFAVQIAKQMGAHVTSTSSGENRDVVMSLGADAHIDYRETAFDDVLSDIDFVFDTVGGDTLEKSVKVLRKGGLLMSIASRGLEEKMAAAADDAGGSFEMYLVQTSGADMAELASMMEAGTLRPLVYKTFGFDDLRAAHTEVELGRTVGKVIVTV